MKKILIIMAIAIAIPIAYFGIGLFSEINKAISEDPVVWENDISELQQRANQSANPREAVLFVGSSSIRLWSSLAEDMAPYTTIQQGFGGAKLNDVVYYAKRLINHYTPKAIVVFAGTNDITPKGSKSPETLLASYRALVKKIRSDLPETPIYFIHITPSPLRWDVWDIASDTNRLITAYSASQANLYVIDTAPGLLDENGEPDNSLYRFDGLHLSEKGYAVWTKIIKERLDQDFGQ